MNNLLTGYYTFLLIMECKKHGKCKTMRAVKLKSKLKGLV